MEADGSETEEVTWSDGDDGKCRAECGLERRPMSETGDQRSEVRGRNDMVMTMGWEVIQYH
jgi:hypothetical protein